MDAYARHRTPEAQALRFDPSCQLFVILRRYLFAMGRHYGIEDADSLLAAWLRDCIVPPNDILQCGVVSMTRDWRLLVDKLKVMSGDLRKRLNQDQSQSHSPATELSSPPLLPTEPPPPSHDTVDHPHGEQPTPITPSHGGTRMSSFFSRPYQPWNARRRGGVKADQGAAPLPQVYREPALTKTSRLLKKTVGPMPSVEFELSRRVSSSPATASTSAAMGDAADVGEYMHSVYLNAYRNCVIVQTASI